MGHLIVYHIISPTFFPHNPPSISLPECHQILFLYSYFKSVLEYESYIIFCLYNHFLYKTAPNPGIELAGYAVLLFQSANGPFKQFSLCLLAVRVLNQCHLVKLITNNKDCVYILRKGCDNQRKIKI